MIQIHDHPGDGGAGPIEVVNLFVQASAEGQIGIRTLGGRTDRDPWIGRIGRGTKPQSKNEGQTIDKHAKILWPATLAMRKDVHA